MDPIESEELRAVGTVPDQNVRSGAMTEIVLITSTACHLCDDARVALDELGREFPIEVREIDIASPEGRGILERLRPPMPPAVLVDGVLFSFGRLPRKKLRRHLERA